MRAVQNTLQAPRSVLMICPHAFYPNAEPAADNAFQRSSNDPTEDQKSRISESSRPVAVDIPTIELAGGSARCMIAGIHLTKRPMNGPVK